MPAIETEVHRALKDVADDVAIKVFAENLRGLLLASPFGPKAVVGVDPGLRTGCKLAVIDASGRFLASELLQLQTDEGKANAKKLLAGILKSGEIQAIAVGNGTAGRETEAFLRAALQEAGFATPVVMVSEAGASVYSASDVAREEFPDLDVTVRGAISIARRLQDPLAELVKIDPKSIGVGQYQHDVAAAALKQSLDQVVDSCVNQVGVNLNTASFHLLAHVSGIGPALAKAVVEHRQEKGLFTSRDGSPGGAALQQQDLRAGRRLPARPRGRQPARQHRRPSRALSAPRGAGNAAGQGRQGPRRRRCRCVKAEAGVARGAGRASPSTTS